MSPNQPKTPITGFRLDEDTRDRLKRIGEQMGTTMTGALKMLAEDAESASQALRDLHTKVAPDMPPLVRFVRDRLLEAERAMTPAGGLVSEQPYHPHIKAVWDVTEAVSETDWASYAVRDVVLERFAQIWKDHPDYREEWSNWRSPVTRRRRM